MTLTCVKKVLASTKYACNFKLFVTRCCICYTTDSEKMTYSFVSVYLMLTCSK